MSFSYIESSVSKLSLIGAIVMAAATLCNSAPVKTMTQHQVSTNRSSEPLTSELHRGTGRLERVAYRGTGRLQTAEHRGTGRSATVAYRGTGRLNTIAYRGTGRLNSSGNSGDNFAGKSSQNVWDYRGSERGFSQGNLA